MSSVWCRRPYEIIEFQFLDGRDVQGIFLNQMRGMVREYMWHFPSKTAQDEFWTAAVISMRTYGFSPVDTGGVPV